jgi:hypothetical protein
LALGNQHLAHEVRSKPDESRKWEGIRDFGG